MKYEKSSTCLTLKTFQSELLIVVYLTYAYNSSKNIEYMVDGQIIVKDAANNPTATQSIVCFGIAASRCINNPQNDLDAIKH